MEVKVVNNLKELYNAVEELGTDVYYLTSPKNSIRKFIEDSGFENKILLNLKLAYNILFDGFLIKDNNEIKVTSIKDVLEKIEKKDLEKIELIVKKDKLADVIQQFMYLNLHINVMEEQERKMFKIKQNFDKNKAKLIDALKDFQLEVNESNKNNENKEKILDKISNLRYYIEKVKDRKLKIAVMATKKTGKSVIVNSFLEEEFAPTSLKLATPNSVVYEEWDKGFIEVKIESDKNLKGYEKEIIKTFNNAKEVKKYLNEMFKKAEQDETNNFAMPDIFIKYPNKNNDFILIDTPGPDLAGSTHSNIAYRWLKQADVVIFAIDYTKYLTPAEEQFLKDIKKELDSQGKFYSLIVTVNKLDARYQDPEDKAIISKLDFIKNRLEKLDESFKNVTLVGTSSLQYFAFIESIKIIKKSLNEVLNENFGEIFSNIENMDNLNEEEETNFFNVDGHVRALKRFHKVKVENIKVKEYLEYSGMPYLIQRTKYIAETKAGMEIFNNLFAKIDSEFTEIKNKFLIKQIENLKSKKNEIEEELNDMEQFFDKKAEEAKDISLKKLTEDGKNTIVTEFEQIGKNIESYIDSNLQDFKDEIKDSEVSKSIDLISIIEPLGNQILPGIQNVTKQLTIEKEKLLNEAEYKIMEINEAIKENIRQRNLEKRYNLKIHLSDLDPALAREKFKINIETIFGQNAIIGETRVNPIKEKEVKKTKEVSDSKWYNPFSWGSTKTVEYFEKEKYLDEDELDSQLNEIKDKLFNLIIKDLEKMRNDSISKLSREIEKFNNSLQIELQNVIANYKKTNNDIKKMLNYDVNELETNIDFFNSIKEKFEKLNNKWENIKKF